MIKISIIIPIFNAEKYIVDAIESALNQTISDVIEIICIDDASTDRSVDIVKSRFCKDSSIQLIQLDYNQGVSAARNTGIRQAIGKFILPLDADDVIDPTYCEKALLAFDNNPELSVVYSEAYKFDDYSVWKWHLKSFTHRRILRSNIVFVSAVYRKVDWQDVGGYDESMLTGLEDWDFWLNFASRNKKFHRIDEYLFMYRQVKESRNKVLEDKHKTNIIIKYIKSKHASFFKRYIIREIVSYVIDIKYSKKGFYKIVLFKIIPIPIYFKA